MQIVFMGKYSAVGRVWSMSTVTRIAGKPVGGAEPAVLDAHAFLGVAVWEPAVWKAFAGAGGAAWPNTARRRWSSVVVSSGSPQCSGCRAGRRAPADAGDLVLVNPTGYLIYSPPLPDMRSGLPHKTREIDSRNRSVRWPRQPGSISTRRTR